MSSPEFGWASLLDFEIPAKCSLTRALFTTYDCADERLLAEHLLPLLFNLGYDHTNEGEERLCFLVELDQRLKQLHDRIVVVSSTAREESDETGENENNTYGWIWRSIRHRTVGSTGKAIQHAKLWMLHWSSMEGQPVEYLEIVVTSANLTRAAFRTQLQAAWRVCLEMRPQGSKQRLDAWGVLPHFLRELAKSAGDSDGFEPFVHLLERAECPEGITFLASVPGKHSRQTLQRTPWGATGLRGIAPKGRGAVSVSILSPFIGVWNDERLRRWCISFDGNPERLELVWIDRDHSWAKHKRWSLPVSTLKTIAGIGASVVQLRDQREESFRPFHEKHRQQDARWSHAKAYLFRRGNSQRLLLTSANFSPSAWGKEAADGELIVENFELGVCIEQGDWPFGDLEPFEDPITIATVMQPPPTEPNAIFWAHADWDGKHVRIACRSQDESTIIGKLTCGVISIPLTDWPPSANGFHAIQFPWTDATQQPSFVELTCSGQIIIVPVFDERPMPERESSIPPEVDEDRVQAIRDRLLFEQYGGLVAGDDGDPNGGEEEQPIIDEKGTSDVNDNYGVPAFELARVHLDVVNCWAERVKRVAGVKEATFERKVLRQDGEQLKAAFERREKQDEQKLGIGARLAAEELDIHLKHFPEA